MTPAREASLVLARRACLTLADYATDTTYTMLGPEHRPLIAALIKEFSRMDKAEQRAQATRTPRAKARTKKG